MGGERTPNMFCSLFSQNPELYFTYLHIPVSIISSAVYHVLWTLDFRPSAYLARAPVFEISKLVHEYDFRFKDAF